MFVADSSVWIDYLAGESTRETEALDRALEVVARVAVCGPVFQEVLQGLRVDREFKRVRLQFSKFPFLEATRRTFSRAASLYRRMRRKGHTPGPFDTLIAAVCLEYDVPLLTSDRSDFAPLVRHAGLKLA